MFCNVAHLGYVLNPLICDGSNSIHKLFSLIYTQEPGILLLGQFLLVLNCLQLFIILFTSVFFIVNAVPAGVCSVDISLVSMDDQGHFLLLVYTYYDLRHYSYPQHSHEMALCNLHQALDFETVVQLCLLCLTEQHCFLT